MYEGLCTLLAALEVVRPAFTEPGYRNLIVIFAGWVSTTGTHAVTQALVEKAVPGRRHHEAFHRFFSRGTWSTDAVGRLLFERVCAMFPDLEPRFAIDDTLAPKKGPNVFGIGSHLDAVRSTKRVRVFTFGHVWVMLCVIVPVPFSSRPWALPILFRLYRNKKDCERKRHLYRKKTELAREMIDVLRGWFGQRRILIAFDSAYCNDTVMHDLPESVVVFGSMRPDAVLTELPRPSSRRKAGRPPVRGKLLPKPEKLAKSERIPWTAHEAHLYGKKQTIYVKELVGQWYRACGKRLLRVIVVKVNDGSIGLRVFFCTDAQMTVRDILQGYSYRWSIEVCFRELKQLLGFADSSARKKEAVERTAPFVGLSYTVLVLWFVQGVHTSPLATPPLRPWYTHKRGLCFADVLRAAQRALAPLDVLDLPRSLDNLREIDARRRSASASRPRRAA